MRRLTEQQTMKCRCEGTEEFDMSGSHSNSIKQTSNFDGNRFATWEMK